MKNEVSIKLHKIDWNYIKRNFLKKELWEKSWKIFAYGDIEVSMNLHTIYIYDNSISMEVVVAGDGERMSSTFYLYTNRLDESDELITRRLIREIQNILSRKSRTRFMESSMYEEVYNEWQRVADSIEEDVTERVEGYLSSMPEIMNKFIDSDSLVTDVVNEMSGKEKLYDLIQEGKQLEYVPEKVMVDLVIGGKDRSEYEVFLETDLDIPEFEYIDMDEDDLDEAIEEVLEGY